jgi:chromosome segregation ATPase
LREQDNELKVYASELARTQEALAALRKQARKYAKEAKHAKKGAALTAKKLENTHIELEQSESMSFVQLESLAEELEREVQSKETIIHEQRLALEKAHSAQLAAAGADQKRAAELRAQENQLGVDRDAVAAQLAGMDVKEAELTAARAENELLLGNVEDLKQKLSASMESTEAARSELAAGHGQSIGGAQSNGHEVEALKAQLAASQEAHRTAIASLQEQLRGKSSLIMELQAQIQEHVEMLEELQCSNGDASQRTLELESVQSQLDEITAELKASKHECSLAKVRKTAQCGALFYCRLFYLCI